MAVHVECADRVYRGTVQRLSFKLGRRAHSFSSVGMGEENHDAVLRLVRQISRNCPAFHLFSNPH
eukprot:1461345-Amphidinium_carterae.1